ncbi:MAG: hypothetical protein K2P94_18510 [Rhodospirillaceae bacterium]|nr:hypothetical protein [Rhodospirillaceae bacterium]
MMRFITVIAAGLMMQTALAEASYAQSPSPLDRPIEDIKRDIAAIAHCEWQLLYKLHYGCSDQIGTWINLELTPDGKIDHFWFLPTVAVVVDVDPQSDEAIYGETAETRADQTAVLAIIKKLWPSWTAGEQWLKNALKKAWVKDAQDSIRVGDTSVYVRESMYVNRDDRYGFFVLTKKTDLTEFKRWSCEDDEQGPGLDNCTKREGARPPDNPILHPK